MCKLIINADDLGISSVVNRTILDAVNHGLLTGASLMVNRPFAEEAAKLVAKESPQLSVGLHFCLTSGRPLAAFDQIPWLLNSQGLFRLRFGGLCKAVYSSKRQEFLSQIRTEFNAQLEMMDHFTQQYGLRFDHLDSHQHIHAIPGVFEILEETAQIRKIVLRVPRENFGTPTRTFKRFSSWFPSGIIKQTLLKLLLRNQTQRVGYFGILDTGKMDSNALLAILSVLEKCSPTFIFEINIHPSQDFNNEAEEADLSPEDRLFYQSSWRKQEYQALNNPAVKKMLVCGNIELVGFP